MTADAVDGATAAAQLLVTMPIVLVPECRPCPCEFIPNVRYWYMYRNRDLDHCASLYICNGHCMYEGMDRTSWHGFHSERSNLKYIEFHCGRAEEWRSASLEKTGEGSHGGEDSHRHRIELHLQGSSKYCTKCNDWHDATRVETDTHKLGLTIFAKDH